VVGGHVAGGKCRHQYNGVHRRNLLMNSPSWDVKLG
jgi:hypothetical protein